MKNVLVIGSRDHEKKNDPGMLVQAITTIGGQAKVVYWEDLIIHISLGGVTIETTDGPLLGSQPDIVLAVGWYKGGQKAIYRDLAYALALFLDHHNITFWNSEMLSQRSSTKLSCMVQLALEGISVPETSFSLTTDLAIKDRSFPFIAKAAAASRGESNFLVRGTADLDRIKNNPLYLLIQSYLENDHDLRIICFGGQPALALRRARPIGADTHLNNTSQGGKAHWLDLATLSPDLLLLCQKVCKVMKREMAGIDFIPDSQAQSGYSCLEVNAIPQLTSGFDVEKKLTAFAQAISLERNLDR